MIWNDHSKRSMPTAPRGIGSTGPSRETGRVRRLTIVVLLVLGLGTAGCTPAEIEASLNRIAVSFEQGGVERGLAEAVFVAEYAVPVIEMRLRAAFGP